MDRILGKDVVIDAFVRLSLHCIGPVAIEVRAIVASVEIWLKYAGPIGLPVDPQAT